MIIYDDFYCGYNPILNTKAITTAKGPVITREYNTAGTPSSMVEDSASPKDNPTGTKSPPTCASIANNAGNAY